MVRLLVEETVIGSLVWKTHFKPAKNKYEVAWRQSDTAESQTKKIVEVANEALVKQHSNRSNCFIKWWIFDRLNWL